MIKIKILKHLVLCATIIFFSCDKDGEIIDITNDCEFYDNILSTCFYGTSGSEYDEIVFNDNDSYQEFGDIVRIYPANLDCDTAQLRIIDFNNYTLLSKRTSGGGCSATYHRKVLKDTEHKKIIYEIEVIYEGTCMMLIGSRNWAIVPKIPDDYIFDFVLK